MTTTVCDSLDWPFDCGAEVVTTEVVRTVEGGAEEAVEVLMALLVEGGVLLGGTELGMDEVSLGVRTELVVGGSDDGVVDVESVVGTTRSWSAESSILLRNIVRDKD